MYVIQNAVSKLSLYQLCYLASPYSYRRFSSSSAVSILLSSYCFSLTALIEAIHQQSDGSSLDKPPIGPASMMQSGVSQAREFDDPPGLHEKTEYLLREWVTLYHSPAAGRDSSKAFCAIVSQVRAISSCVNFCTFFFIYIALRF